MGSFSVACGISGLAVEEGERVGAVLLVPSRLPDLSPTQYFVPLIPPVYGTYADYGWLDSVDAPEPVLEILRRHITDSGRPETVMFFRPDVYEDLARLVRTPYAAQNPVLIDQDMADYDDAARRFAEPEPATETLDEMYRRIDTAWGSYAHSLARRVCHSLAPYNDEGLYPTPELRDGVETLLTLNAILAEVNRQFLPTFCGTQHGSDRFTQRLALITARIAADRLTARDLF